LRDLVHAHDELSALANKQVFAFQAGQMLGDPWPRGADEIGDVLMFATL
jgi:hypothetical protein